MTLVRDEVTAAFRDFSVQFEGVIAWMYLDVKGLCTTGIGCLIDPLPLALALPWQRLDGTGASQAEIEAEWHRVHAMPAAHLASYYKGPLRLSDEAIDTLVAQRLEANAKQLVTHFPEFADWPAEAQQAVLSMAWALGAGFPPHWPHFSAAARAQDWASCAEMCAIRTDGNPGVKPRNDANRALFLAAAQATSDAP